MIGKFLDCLLTAGWGSWKKTQNERHYRQVFHTPEISSSKILKNWKKMKEKIGSMLVAEESAAKSWYKTGPPDIPVISTR